MAGRFRLLVPTLGIITATRLANTIPVGAIIEVPIPPQEGNRLVDVIWEGKEVMMFVNDLNNRSEKIE